MADLRLEVDDELYARALEQLGEEPDWAEVLEVGVRAELERRRIHEVRTSEAPKRV